jgi:hypothetical protein
MLRDPAGHIRRIARFAGIPLDDELLEMTVERSSLGFILAHKDRFDDALMRGLSERLCGLPPGSDSAKVRKGGVGSHEAELPVALSDRMDAIWAEEIAGPLGFADFAMLEAAL